MLTQQDKLWMRRAIREVVQDVFEALAAEAATTQGGYDGRTVVEEDEVEPDEVRRRAQPVIGFLQPDALLQALNAHWQAGIALS